MGGGLDAQKVAWTLQTPMLSHGLLVPAKWELSCPEEAYWTGSLMLIQNWAAWFQHSDAKRFPFSLLLLLNKQATTLWKVFQSSPHSNGKGQHLGGGTKSNNNRQPLGGRNSFQLLKCLQSCSWKELNLCQDLSESRVDLFLVSKQGCRPTNTLIAALYNPKHDDPVKQCPYS